jgi:hypothetical protein
MLSKAQSRLCRDELRDLVNAHDPIGLIATGASQDEYECVVGPLMGPLERGAPTSEIGLFLAAEFRYHFGSPISHAPAMEFTARAQAWYASPWRPVSDWAGRRGVQALPLFSSGSCRALKC